MSTIEKEVSSELYQFISGLQKLEPHKVIVEVMSSGFSEDEIIIIFKEIAFNDTFKFKSK